ncbi:MAG: phosphoribosylamine--glycine ligase [Candidatus Zixiibacteriota bacterium]
MKILIVGGGGREHALAWKLSQSPKATIVYGAPGNAGIEKIGKCVSIKADDIKTLADFAQRENIDLTLVGPELPLTLGIVDEFETRNLKIFGPSQAASMIEGSKAFAKEFMRKYHIPTASFQIFEQKDKALNFISSTDFPVVIKADGLAAGKGSIIAQDFSSAEQAINKILVEKVFGEAGSRVVVEDFLEGEEVTIMAFTDGNTIVPMVSSQDYKRAYTDDRGPNTGGMGSYAPTLFINERMMKKIQEEILEPTVAGLENEGRIFKGILYAGLIITEVGPKVMEYNCRFGDPETQVVLPLLKDDLLEIFLSVLEEELDLVDINWKDEFCVCVVLASAGYPGKYDKGIEIFGLDKAEEVTVFHAGTKTTNGKVVTNGGRVIGVTAVDKNTEKTISKAYSAIEKIRFKGMQFRKDIGRKATKVERKYF